MDAAKRQHPFTAILHLTTRSEMGTNFFSPYATVIISKWDITTTMLHRNLG